MIIHAKKAWKITQAKRTMNSTKQRVNTLILESINKGNSFLEFESNLPTIEEDNLLCHHLNSIGYATSRSRVGVIQISWYNII